MMRLDVLAADIAKRLSKKHGRRASELYPFAAALLKNGIDEQEVEQQLDLLCEACTASDEPLKVIIAESVERSTSA